MKRRFGLVVVALVLVTSSVGWDSLYQSVSANSEITEKISNVQRERQEKQQEAKKTEEEIQQLEQEMQQMNEDIRKIDHEVTTTNQKIREKRAEIEEVRSRIETLQAEILVLEERIAERDVLLKDRARTMYQTGGSINYLEVILGAKDFGDFLDRVGALSVIAQQDRNIIEAHIEDHQQLEETKAEVESELASLEVHLNDLESLMADLESQRAQKDNLMAQLKKREGDLHLELGEIENADEILRAQEAALERELAEYEERKRREAEAERKRQQEAASQANTQTETQTTSRNSQVHSAPAVTNSGFMRPATGTITSTYGPRSSFGGRMHHGIDIGKNGRTGDVPIVAVQDGTVVSARYMNGYGNTVIIAHYVEGRLITTLYAHMDSLSVSGGQRVSKGQTLGMMGNTGDSFGPHLHFEVHEGGWNGAKSNSVDPLRYIPR